MVNSLQSTALLLLVHPFLVFLLTLIVCVLRGDLDLLDPLENAIVVYYSTCGIETAYSDLFVHSDAQRRNSGWSVVSESISCTHIPARTLPS